MCQLTFTMFDKERVVEEIPDTKPEATSDTITEDVVVVADCTQQKNHKTPKDDLHRKSKRDRDEDFLFRNIHYHREILVPKILSAPDSSAKETRRKFGIDELPPLHRAAAKASVEVIADLLGKGMDVNEKIPFSMWDEDADFQFRGASPLFIAAWFGKTKSIDLLLEHGANINSLDSDGAGILEYAMCGPCRGRIVMRLLSTYGADPNIRNCHGNLPLHVAALKGISLLIHPLFEAGNELNDQNNCGSTPLEIASRSGHEQAVQALLDLGADTTIHQTCAKCCQRSPLHSASLNGSEPVVDMLLQEAPNLMTPDINGDTALHLAAQKNHFGVARLLLASGADVTAKDTFGKTALHLASEWGGLETAILLIEKGADVNSLDQRLFSPLHYALLYDHGNVAKYLHGLDTTVITISDEEGYSYLHYTSMFGSDLLGKLLLDDRLDIEALTTPLADSKSICGTPLVLASRNGQTTAAKKLLDHGANIHALCTQTQQSSLHMAVMGDHMSTVKLLVERGASVECRDADGDTPLISGSRNGSKSIEILLEAGADVNAFNKNGCTALHWSCYNGHESVVEQLLISGAQNRKDNNGLLPWHYAANGVGSEPIIQLLLRYFPDSVNARGRSGCTALHSAAIQGNLPLVNLLLKNGAGIEAKTDDGEIPLDYAVYNGSEPIVQLLLQQSPHTIKARRNDGETLLHCAVRGGQLSTMKLLLMIDPTLLDVKADIGLSALFLAVLQDKKEIVELLLQHGCQLTLRKIDGAAPWDIINTKVPRAEIIDLLVTHGWDMDERYWKGRTAFHVAVLDGDEEAARSLIRRCCNIEIGDDDGDTPLDAAIMKGNLNMQTLIRQALETRKSTSSESTKPEPRPSRTDTSNNKNLSEKLCQLTIVDSPETVTPPEIALQSLQQVSA
jgi:ankyrin repeat protein